jgi:hypothetical protein
MFKKVTLERTACFGICPIYRIEVDSLGRVKWSGVENVIAKGTYEWTIPHDKIIELNDLINSFDYASYVYKPIGHPKTDYPRAISSVLYDNGYFKKINHYLGDTLSGNELANFENRIDEIVGNREYVGKRNNFF